MDRGEELIGALWDMLNTKRALDQRALKAVAGDLDLSELRCTDCVGTHQRVNPAKLAGACYITSGAASKLTRGLLTQGLLDRYQKLENRKEVYFRLTPAGQTLCHAQGILGRKLEFLLTRH